MINPKELERPQLIARITNKEEEDDILFDISTWKDMKSSGKRPDSYPEGVSVAPMEVPEFEMVQCATLAGVLEECEKENIPPSRVVLIVDGDPKFTSGHFEHLSADDDLTDTAQPELLLRAYEAGILLYIEVVCNHHMNLAQELIGWIINFYEVTRDGGGKLPWGARPSSPLWRSL